MPNSLQLALHPVPVWGECLPSPRGNLRQVRFAALVVVVIFVVVLVALGCEPLLALSGAIAVVTAIGRLLR